MRLQPAPRQDRVEHNGELQLPAVGGLRDLRLQKICLLQQRTALFEQHFARGRQFGAVAAAVKDQCVEIILQFAHGIGDGRRHAPQLLRGATEAAMAGDGVKNFEGFKGDFQHVRYF